MAAASTNPRPGRISQKVIGSVTTAHSQCNCASTFQPVPSICASALRRAASRRACQVASALRAVRWIARQIALRLMVKSKALLQNGGGSGMRQPLQLVHQHCQCHCLRPHLHRRCSDRVGALQRMPPLHTLPTLRTPADGNVKPPYPCAPYDLFLILRLDPLQGQKTGTRRTLRRNWHRDLHIHTLRQGPTLMPSIAGARLAAWGFRMTLWLAPRKGSRLTPGCALRGLQLLLQALNLFPQPRIFVL